MIIHTCKLADIGMIFNGKTPSQEEQRSDGFPVLKIKDVSDDGRFVGYFDSYVSFNLAKEFAAKVICPGDTLILNAAHNADYVGSKIYFAETSVAGTLPTGEWLLIRPDAQKGNPRYINFWLQTTQMRRKIKDLVKGIHLYPKDVANLSIYLPPLSEQKRIAVILEKADRLRRQRHYALELSSTYLQSVFLEMFGDPPNNPRNWKIQSLVSISQRFSDGPFGSNLKTEHYTSSGIRVIRLQNIGIGQLIDDDKAYISESHFASLGKYSCLPGDVVVGTLGDPNLRACILPDSIPVALNKADCVQIRTNPDLAIAEYICWLLNMPHTLFMATGMIHGQTRARINMGRLADLQVPVPPLPLQQKFAQIAQKFERLRAQQREAERQAEHLFQTLLHQAFEGNVGVGSGGVQGEAMEDVVQSSVVDSQLTGSFLQLEMKY